MAIGSLAGGVVLYWAEICLYLTEKERHTTD